MGVDAVARTRRGPRLSSARSDIDVGIIVFLKCSTIRFVGFIVGVVNFVGGGVNFVSGRGRGSTSPSVEGVEATSDLWKGSFCQMTVGTTECVDPLERSRTLSSRAVAELSKEERIIASAVSVARATESTTDFLRGSRAD